MGGRTVVRDGRERGRDIRLLLVRGTRQSAMWLDDPFGECPFPYLQKFDLTFAAEPVPQRVLLIGGAGYAWPRHVLATRPEVRLTVVEIDPEMNRLARAWFCLDELERRHGPEGDGRLELVVARGLDFLRECAAAERQFDAIANDTFIASSPTRSLLSAESARLVRSCLAPGGVYLANVVSALAGPEAAVLDGVCEAYGGEFGQVSVVPCTQGNPTYVTNSVVIASDSGLSFPGTWLTVAGVD